MAIGDRVLGAKGEWLKITDLLDTGEFEPVSNMRIADSHTYFVGMMGGIGMFGATMFVLQMAIGLLV